MLLLIFCDFHSFFNFMRYPLTKQQLETSTFIIRTTGVALLATIFIFLIWGATHLNLTSPLGILSATLFILGSLMISISGITIVINNWNFKLTKPSKTLPGSEQNVAIIIPTYNESIEIVLNTLRSIIKQNWPKNRRIIVVSDDGNRQDLKDAVKLFCIKYTEDNIFYHTPPHKGSPLRKGEAKSGNLNSALHFVLSRFPKIKYVETRDADDLVGNKDFLSYCLAHLEKNPECSFVQTVKKCHVDFDDPFSNQETIFYERTMPARNAVNAVFPCGSGLVWRVKDIKKIGGFPTWNLVEDLQSGFEALRLGGKGEYIPIIGAVGQIAPEDIPNFYKQRGTWALDTVRLLFWKNPFFTKGLSLRQKLQFFELEFSYLLSFALFMFIIDLCITLAFDIYPISTTALDYVVHICALMGILELFIVAKARGVPYKEQWRNREAWFGLMPVFMIATLKALWYGPHKKPAYTVTRKYHKVGWYWRETSIQTIIVTIFVLLTIYKVFYVQLDNLSELGILLWVFLLSINFSRVIRNSWFGLEFRPLLGARKFTDRLEENYSNQQ
jgi:cellulose synthase (UDP-forming)